MTFSKGFSKRLLSGLLAILMIFILSVTVFADAWEPAGEDAYYNKNVDNLLNEASGRRKMNLFLSNFSEANLHDFDSENDLFNTSDMDILAYLFKHFELNASLYPSVSIINDGDFGKIMTVSLSTVEKAEKRMFYRPFTKSPVTDFSGYRNGMYIVTANEAYSQLKVLSIADRLKYNGDGVYMVEFEIYKTESNIDNYYSYSSDEAIKSSSLKGIGEGYAEFNYVGGTGSAAFRLVSYELIDIDKSELVYTQANEPVLTDITTIATTNATTNEQTDKTSYQETTISDKAVINDAKDKADLYKLILLTGLVILTAITATGIIILVFKKRK